MIFLITGALGAGKTSNIIWDLITKPEFKSRPKYASFIRGFKYDELNFEQIDKTDLENWVTWTDPDDDFSTVSNFPAGSILLFDEADLFFPSSIPDKNPPRWLREMARSRHHGLDFYIITQQTKMVSQFLLGLIQTHIHFHRPNGSETVTRYSWEHYQPNVHSKANRLIGLPQRVLVNPEVFTLYESTVENTRVKTPPVHIYKKLAFLAMPLLIAPFFVYWFMYGRHQLDAPTSEPTEQSTSITKPAESSPAHEKKLIEPTTENMSLTAQDFVPPVSTMPWAAPAYADLAKPTDFPRIAACIESKKTGCKCFTQQYTPIDVPKDSCSRMVKEGWFDNWSTGRAQQDQVLSGKPDEVSRRNEQNSKSISPQGV